MNKSILLIVLIFLDLITKYYFSTNLLLNETIKLNNYVELIYIQNFGISFGLFSEILPTWFINMIGLIIVIFLFYLISLSNSKLERIAFFIIIIGAVSNILDRIINGYVVDFIVIHYKSFYWPAFNFADMYITLGIIMLIITFFKKTKNEL